MWQVGNIQGPPSGTPPINTATTVGWQPDGIMLSGIGADVMQTAETGIVESKYPWVLPLLLRIEVVYLLATIMALLPWQRLLFMMIMIC